MLSINFKDNLKVPDLNFNNELDFIARRIIIPDIQKNMVAETDIEGNIYAPLAESTIKIKKRKGYSGKILEATGQLKKSFVYGVRKNVALITLMVIRKTIGKYLQVDGVKSKVFGKRKFNFFGISKQAEKLALDHMELNIRRRVKNAGSK